VDIIVGYMTRNKKSPTGKARVKIQKKLNIKGSSGGTKRNNVFDETDEHVKRQKLPTTVNKSTSQSSSNRSSYLSSNPASSPDYAFIIEDFHFILDNIADIYNKIDNSYHLTLHILNEIKEYYKEQEIIKEKFYRRLNTNGRMSDHNFEDFLRKNKRFFSDKEKIINEIQGLILNFDNFQATVENLDKEKLTKPRKRELFSLKGKINTSDHLTNAKLLSFEEDFEDFIEEDFIKEYFKNLQIYINILKEYFEDILSGKYDLIIKNTREIHEKRLKFIKELNAKLPLLQKKKEIMSLISQLLPIKDQYRNTKSLKA